MLQPVGPLSASVYWRRRALAAAVVLLLLVVGWQLLPGGGGDDGRGTTAGAAGSPTPTDDTSQSLAATPPAGDPGRPGDGTGDPTGPSTAGGGTGTTGPGTGPTATPAPTTPAPAPTTAAAPKPCPDSALRLRVVPARSTYQVGQSPVLNLEVRNISAVACVRDLGAAQQEILLYAGSKRLWSSNDCYPEGERATTLLRPGAVDRSEVTWSGLASQPRCPNPSARPRVGAGSYTLLGRLGTLISKRAPIALRPSGT